MNYNQFYRKKDKYKRNMTPNEKANAKIWGRFFVKSIGAGMIAGIILILLLKLLA